MLKKLALACLLAAPSLASAGGVYLVAGGASGSADLQDIENTYAPPYATDDKITRALIGIGASVSPYLAVEGLYMSEADVTVESTGPGYRDTLEHSGIQLAVIGKAPITPQFSMFGRLAANYLSTTYTVEDTSIGYTMYEEDKTSPHLGIGFGAAFQVNDAVGVRLQWERIMIQDLTIVGASGLESGDVDVDQTSVALTFNF